MSIGTVVVLFLCFIKGSKQISFDQAVTLSRISNITDLFTAAHITRNGVRVGVYDVLPYLGTSGEQTYVGPGFPEIAMPDECSPRLTTVEIPRDSNDDANVMYWPMCTRIQRCGGCCANDMIRCVPERTETRAYTILKVKLWDSSDPEVNMDWEGVATVEMETHVKCKLECSITARDCNRRQMFDSFDCSCRCRRTRQCSPVQRWDLETCDCVCKDPERVCEPGSTFNRQTCSCRINSSDQRYSNLQIDEAEAVHVNEGQSNVVEVTREVTTAAPTTINPCATHFCPRFFLSVLGEDGDCVCSPTFSFNRH